MAIFLVIAALLVAAPAAAETPTPDPVTTDTQMITAEPSPVTPEPEVAQPIYDDGEVLTDSERETVLNATTAAKNEADVVFVTYITNDAGGDVDASGSNTASELRVGDPEKQNGVLIYVDVATRDATVVASQMVADKIGKDRIADVMNTVLIPKVRAGDTAEAITESITGIVDAYTNPTIGDTILSTFLPEGAEDNPQLMRGVAILATTIATAFTLIATLVGFRVVSWALNRRRWAKQKEHLLQGEHNATDFWENLSVEDRELLTQTRRNSGRGTFIATTDTMRGGHVYPFDYFRLETLIDNSPRPRGRRARR